MTSDYRVRQWDVFDAREDSGNVVGLIRVARDVPEFAKSGHYVWIVRYYSLGPPAGGVSQELWLDAATGEVLVVLPPVKQSGAR